MATETYTYFRADIDTDLRSVYGGGALLTGRGSTEMRAIDLFHRHLAKQLNSHTTKTDRFYTVVQGSGQYWCKIESSIYAGLSHLLSAAQLATVTTTQPAGTSSATDAGRLFPVANKTNIFLIGDSLTRCQGSTNSMQDHHINRAIEAKGEVFTYGNANTEAESRRYRVLNIAVSGAAFDGVDVYPENWMASYNHHLKTLPTAERMVFFIALGSNDASHDGAVSGATIWTRNLAFLALLKADFPNAKYVVQTLVKRGTASSLNDRLAAYNTLVRANWQTAGYDALCDVEANVPQLNITTGDTTNLTYYGDGTHMTKASYDLQVPTATAVLNTLGW